MRVGVGFLGSGCEFLSLWVWVEVISRVLGVVERRPSPHHLVFFKINTTTTSKFALQLVNSEVKIVLFFSASGERTTPI